MSSPRLSTLRLRTVFAKLSLIAILLTASIEVMASCQSLESQGFEIFSICAATFDSQGNYVDSNCALGDPPMPGQNYYNACLEAAAGCTGTACTYDPPIFD
jgi:hypothetical protein